MSLHAENGAEHDLPAHPTPRAYLIASHPRSGSSLLARALWDTGRAGRPWEYFGAVHIAQFHARWRLPHAPAPNPAWWDRAVRALRRRLGHRAPTAGERLGLERWTQEAVRDYVERLVAHRTTENGVFGVKAHHEQVDVLFFRKGLDPAGVLPDLRVVWIERRDRVRQAVSLVRARASSRWSADQAGRDEAPYRREAIDDALADIQRWDDAWAPWLASRPPVLRLTYEDLTSDWVGTLSKTFDALDLSPPARWPEPGQRKQSDHISEAWVQRYRAG